MLEIIGLALACIDIYFPTLRDRIESFMDRQADLAPTRIRPLLRLGGLTLGVVLIGIACAFLVAIFYRPEVELQSLPPVDSATEWVEQVVGELIRSALAFFLLLTLAILAPLFVALGVLGIIALVAMAYAVAPVSSVLNKVSGGHAFAALGLALALIGLAGRIFGDAGP